MQLFFNKQINFNLFSAANNNVENNQEKISPNVLCCALGLFLFLSIILNRGKMQYYINIIILNIILCRTILTHDNELNHILNLTTQTMRKLLP